MSFAALAAAISLAFAMVVGDRYRKSRRPAFAAWSGGFLIFAAAAAVQAWGEAGGFSVAQFRAFYLLGGVLGVIWLAQGTLFLLAPRSWARASGWALLLLTLLLAWDSVLVPVDPGRLHSAAGVLGDALVGSSPLRVGAILLNIIGSLILVGGSAYSAWRLWRDRAGMDRVACNVLLTAGALVIASGFSAAKLSGAHLASLDVLGLYEAIGVCIMFAGFLSLGRFKQLRLPLVWSRIKAAD